MGHEETLAASRLPLPVLKETHTFLLVYNLVRAVTVEAACQQRKAPHRISLLDALRWLQPPNPDGELFALLVNPPRPGRFEPRCRKRRPKKYTLMTRPRAELKKSLEKKRKTG